MSRQPRVVGLDIGGSKTHALAAEVTGPTVREVFAGSANLSSVGAAEVSRQLAVVFDGIGRDGVAQEPIRRGSFPLHVGGRKVRADVAVADRGEQGVGEGVEHDIRVRMAAELPGMRDLHAPKPDVVALDEGVHVEALAGPHVEKG